MVLVQPEQNKSKMNITKKDFKRFEKQIILKNVGFAGQKKISSAKVLIIGIGGLGCPLLLYLANSGVGNLGIVDNDRVELSNLNRQVLYTQKDIGKFKVDQAKNKILKINKDIKIKSYNKRINKNNIIKILKKFDIICDCTDNFSTRCLINDFCLKQKKILISAAINKFEGQLLSFNFKKKTPCYRCFMSEIPDLENNCDTDGIIPPIAGIMGTMQAQEVLKTIIDTKGKLLNEILIFDGIEYKLRKATIRINSRCKNKC